MEPLRILHVLGILNRGGAETMVMNLYRNIDRSKLQFDFIVHSDEKGDYDEEIKSLGGKIFYVPRYSPRTVISYGQAWHKFFHEHQEYRLIHGHVRSTASIYLTIAKKYKLTTVAHSHSTSSGSGANALFKYILQKPLKGNLADHLFACSEAAGEWLFGRKNRDRVLVLKNSIDAKKFTYNETVRDQMRKDLALDQRFVIGHIGRFEEPKNHIFLIDIFKEIHNANRNALLLMVGRGNLENQVKYRVKELGLDDSVRFMGVRPDVAELLQAMDVFVFPSLYEGIPVTIVEAQAAGLPCILSDTVTDEVNITDLVTYFSLRKSAQRWAEEVRQHSGQVARKNTYSEIAQAGYDVKSTARWLQEFYLNDHFLNSTKMSSNDERLFK